MLLEHIADNLCIIQLEDSDIEWGTCFGKHVLSREQTWLLLADEIVNTRCSKTWYFALLTCYQKAWLRHWDAISILPGIIYGK